MFSLVQLEDSRASMDLFRSVEESVSRDVLRDDNELI